MATVSDLQRLRDEVREKYAGLAADPSAPHHFHTGRPLAERLGYPRDVIDGLPEKVVEAFAGVGNPFAIRDVPAGATVLDVGCGAGFDSVVAARRVGPSGKVIGVDMTEAMLDRARENARLASVDNAEFRHGFAEALPLEDSSVDIVISNGVFNLCPDKRAAYAETFRVLRPGGFLMMADIVVRRAVPEGAKSDPDLWTS